MINQVGCRLDYCSFQLHSTRVQLFFPFLIICSGQVALNIHTFQLFPNSSDISSAILVAGGLLSLACMQLPVFLESVYYKMICVLYVLKIALTAPDKCYIAS